MLRRLRPVMAAAAAWLLLTTSLAPHPEAQVEVRGPVQITAGAPAEIRQWTPLLEGMLRGGELRRRPPRPDRVMSVRSHDRADQYHRGVRVFGGDVVLQMESAQVLSIFGTLHRGVDLDTAPVIDEAGALAAVERRGAEPHLDAPELVVLPRDAGAYLLAWRIRATLPGDIRQFFVDARTGAVLLDFSDVKSQVPIIGTGTGVLGDQKKLSVRRAVNGQYVAEDGRRPPTLRTYDMQGNITRTVDFLSGRVNLNPATELAADADNNWTDVMAVDAHVYSGWTYDFLFKRFNRRGLDNGDVRIVSLVHPARREDFSTPLGSQWPLFFANAAYFGSGVVAYGVGLPPGVTAGGRTWDYMSGALDIVAHELAHGVTDYTSDLIYLNEPGALNEAFSDIVGTSVEFFYQPAGTGPLRADYLLGEDVVRPNGIRSMADPGMFGHPDHYAIRYTGTADNGGVHINSGIANHAFYLAIEGGTNRTSGMAVLGVGGVNRQQIENVFYRAFTELLPSSATFSIARAATIQAARDLYGVNSSPERAVTEAWTAVGVH
ncbi:MAG: peptidase M4 family protein [Acidobacteria bacterium]|nr:peptidase M4 family protein [Acidobacteriota bacterium]